MEVILASLLIVHATCGLLAGEVKKWASTIISQTKGYDDTDPAAKSPWASPPSRSKGGNLLFAQVKGLLFTGASQKLGFVAPVVAVMLSRHETGLSAIDIYRWTRRLCATAKSKDPKPFFVPDGYRRLRWLHMPPALALQLDDNYRGGGDNDNCAGCYRIARAYRHPHRSYESHVQMRPKYSSLPSVLCASKILGHGVAQQTMLSL